MHSVFSRSRTSVRSAARYSYSQQLIVQVLEINDRYSKNLKKVMAAWEAENQEEPEEEEQEQQQRQGQEQDQEQEEEQDQDQEQERSSQVEAASLSRPPASVTSQSEASSEVQADSRSAPQNSNSLSDWTLNNGQGIGANPPAAVEENSEQQ